MPPNLSLIRGKKCTFRKAIFPGTYIQGDGAIGELPAVINRFGGKGLIVASPSAMDGPLAKLRDQLPQGTTQVRFNGQCSDTELVRLASILSKHGPSVVAGAGGGKAIDAAKVLADRAGLPAITLPTIASTEAPCSACAILHNEQGVAQQVHCLRRNPETVLVDSGIIARAPVRYLTSGMGNALATWFEARSCERTASPNECGGFRTFSSITLARLCYDT
ncbi:MAG: iron-containing alcohol dehydrogenase, partial [Polyangiaceae bacterium]|nr:iron-containing alcohol dehydrogenase [Polyangiaceae bacterium]